MDDYDVIIVGAGPAGLTAGIYTARSGLKVLILEEKCAGGLMAEAPFIENYPGLDEGIVGLELASRMEKQARKFGVQINYLEKVVALNLPGRMKTVQTEKNTYRTSTVILSLGCSHRHLNVPGENEFHGRGVSYCPICDGPFFKGKQVLVIGGGNSAATAAIYLSALGSKVTLVYRRHSLMRVDHVLLKELDNVAIVLNTAVKEIKGDTMVRSVLLEEVETGKRTIIAVDGVFIQVGEEPCSKKFKNIGLQTNEEGYIIVNARQQTNFEGVYAAGDITTCPVKQVGTAVGQAIIASIEAFSYLQKYTNRR